MKLENLNRAKDLFAMKSAALRLITDNTVALELMKKYAWDSGYYPFDYDMTRQVGSSATSETKFVKRITIKGSSHMIGEVYCTIPLDTLIKAVEDNIKRLNDRVKEIDKEVATL